MHKLYSIVIAGVLSSLCAPVLAQFTGTINTYARVTAIAASTPSVGFTTFTVDNVTGASALTSQFGTAGSTAMIIQMRGATVTSGAGLLNSNTHGAISLYNNAGNNEVLNVTGTTATTIVVNRVLQNSYTVGEGLQIIHVPVSTAATATIIGNLTAPVWSPANSTGGVIALIAQNILDVQANIVADARGFTFGTTNNNGGGAPCDNTSYASDHPVSIQGAQKGSGIAPQVATEDGGRGRWANGGGGGNRNNGGGGGGGNYTSGGTGGSGVVSDANCAFPANDGGRGVGGDQLTYTSAKLFLGGGGGGGHQDSNLGTSGGAGGGIVILDVGTLTVTGARTISANGAAGIATTAGGTNDGAGGAGAGGVVILAVRTYNLPGSPGCANSLTVSVNGGNGGNSSGNNATTRGGGGGGGAGYLAVTNTAYAGQCITFNSNPGTQGASCIAPGLGCPTTVGSGPGSLPPGCAAVPCTTPVGPITSPLPVSLLSFSGKRVGGDVALKWVTATELNNSHFALERSTDARSYQFVASLPGQGTTQQITTYQYLDPEVPAGELRYRLRQIDYDGTEHFYGPIRIRVGDAGPTLRVIQNPVAVGQSVSVEISGLAGQRLELVDLAGRLHAYQLITELGTALVLLRSQELTPGTYIVRVPGTALSERVLVQ